MDERSTGMGKRLGRLHIYRRLNNHNKKQALIIILSFTLSCMIMSVLLSMQANNRMIYDEIAGGNQENYIFIFYGAEQVIGILSVICFLIASFGFIAVSYLKMVRQEKAFTLFRVFGMGRKDAVYFTVLDSFILTAASSVLGFILGHLLFIRISAAIIGIAAQVPFLSRLNLISFIKVFLLSLAAITFCNYTVYSHYENIDLAAVLYGRPKARQEKGMPYKWNVLGVLVYSAGIILMLEQKKGLIIIVAACFIFLVFLYFLFLRLMKAVHANIKNTELSIWKFSGVLMASRRKMNAFIAAALTAGLLLLFALYGVYWGIEGLLERTWIEKQGFSVCIQMDYDPEAEGLLAGEFTQEGIAFSRLYTKLAALDETMEGAEVDGSWGRQYYLGVIRDAGDNPAFLVKPGSMAVDKYYLFMTGKEAGEKAYVSVTDAAAGAGGGQSTESEFTIGRILENRGLSPVSYTVLVNYEDFADNIDDSYYMSFLLKPLAKEMIRIEQICGRYDVEIVTGRSMLKMIKDEMANYFTLLTISFFLLTISIAVFIFSIVYAGLILRKKEFLVYQSFGASYMKAKQVVALEHLFISLLSVATATVLFTGGFFIMTSIMNGGVHYYTPVGIIALVLLLAVIFVQVIIYLVINNFSFGNAVELLRE